MLEYLVIAIVVLAAAAYLVRTFILTASGRSGACGAGCGCSGTGPRDSNLGKRKDIVTLTTNSTRRPR
jgi:hypothetical protein